MLEPRPPQYRICWAVKTIRGLWDEWTVVLRGLLVIAALDRKWGSWWRAGWWSELRWILCGWRSSRRSRVWRKRSGSASKAASGTQRSRPLTAMRTPYSSTYHAGTGTLQLYAQHVTPPTAPGGVGLSTNCSPIVHTTEVLFCRSWLLQQAVWIYGLPGPLNHPYFPFGAPTEVALVREPNESPVLLIRILLEHDTAIFRWTLLQPW
jgi:hypothetical protein